MTHHVGPGPVFVVEWLVTSRKQTLYAVRGNRWVTVAIAVPHTPASRLRAEAALLAIRAFRLTAQAAS